MAIVRDNRRLPMVKMSSGGLMQKEKPTNGLRVIEYHIRNKLFRLLKRGHTDNNGIRGSATYIFK